ncbi:MAG: hypothetical protein M3Q95_15255 [Bacteroidota bacterium]|nr:hypothetical protein [Bacteroidota bacterium]
MKNQENPNDNVSPLATPGLDRIGQANVFQTPANYFEKLPVILTDRIHRAPVQQNLLTSRMFIVAITTMIAIVAGVLYFVNYTNEKTVAPQLTSDEIIDSGVFAEMDEFMLVEAFQTELYTESEALQPEMNPVSNQMEEYLIENNTDITLIINEL